MGNYDSPFSTLPFGIFCQIWTEGTSRHIPGTIVVISEICHFLGGLSLHLHHSMLQITIGHLGHFLLEFLGQIWT